MLNQAFPKFMKTPSNEEYVLDKQYHNTIIYQNTSTNCWLEKRLWNDYTKEILYKLNLLWLEMSYLSDKVIMDICGGAWFLSFHLLKWWIKPEKLVICDISQHELSQAKEIIDPIKWDIVVEYLCKNISEEKSLHGVFDIIIGNSFLHHFYDLPAFLKSIYLILKDWGYFVSTHEPSTRAIAIEAGSIVLRLYSLIRWEKYIDDIRYKADHINPNNLWDVRVFDDQKLFKVFYNTWFNSIVIKHLNLFKTLLSTNLWLFPLPIKLSEHWRSKLKKIGAKMDYYIAQVIPNNRFWEIIFSIRKTTHHE